MKTYTLITGLFLITHLALSAQSVPEVAFHTSSNDRQETLLIHPTEKPLVAPPLKTRASYEGGAQALAHFIQSKMKYPAIAREYGVEGQVVVAFVVSTTGEIQDIEITESLGYGCDNLARSIIQQMPKWNPAKLGSQPVPSKVKIPIQFSLK